MLLYWNANALFSSEVFRDEVREGCLQEGIGSGCVLVRFCVAFIGALECTRIELGFPSPFFQPMWAFLVPYLVATRSNTPRGLSKRLFALIVAVMGSGRLWLRGDTGLVAFLC